jgi:hypothetical protein
LIRDFKSILGVSPGHFKSSKEKDEQKMFTYKIDSGIEYDEICEYFSEVTSRKVNDEFMSMDWQVKVTQLEDRLHSVIRIPRTLLEFTGKKESCMLAIEKYRKKFMRGGG